MMTEKKKILSATAYLLLLTRNKNDEGCCARMRPKREFEEEDRLAKLFATYDTNFLRSVANIKHL